MFNKALILAGGEGHRMRPLTALLPKALVEVNNKALIQYSLDFLKNKVNEVYITYNYKSQLLFNEVKDKVTGFINTTGKDNAYFLFNSFIKDLNEPILVLPCDMIIDIDLDVLYKDYMNQNKPAIMLIGTSPKNDILGDYLFYNNENAIINIDRVNESNYYCSGLQIINPKKVNEICAPVSNFYDVWSQLMTKKAQIKISNIKPKKWSCYDTIKQIKESEESYG